MQWAWTHPRENVGQWKADLVYLTGQKDIAICSGWKWVNKLLMSQFKWNPRALKAEPYTLSSGWDSYDREPPLHFDSPFPDSGSLPAHRGNEAPPRKIHPKHHSRLIMCVSVRVCVCACAFQMNTYTQRCTHSPVKQQINHRSSWKAAWQGPPMLQLKRVVKEMPCQPLPPFINPPSPVLLTQTNGGRMGRRRQTCCDSYSSNEFPARCSASSTPTGIEDQECAATSKQEYSTWGLQV